ncbi:CGNR zinc finger domain-containing protein [Actinoplanes sp. CA-051413]|uniref:CGNR zinc finger domain-containing protein n=1 Tax=Actinoplanes sp. CA-051413 TaxID=3239899 RepID=UPI003D98BF97
MRTWLLPDEPVPVRLMATIWADTDGVHDDLAGPPDLDEWLDAIGVARHGATATRDEFLRARALRDSVRRLAAFVTGDDRPAAASAVPDVRQALESVNAVVRELPVPQLVMHEASLELAAGSAASPVTAALAEVAAEAQQLLSRGSLLRACHAPGCVLYFARTHPRREWCSVACGNRVRAARHYRTVRSARPTRDPL